MKLVLQYIWNIFLFTLYYGFLLIHQILWHGKLPKVSPYHFYKKDDASYTASETFNDENVQGDRYHNKERFKSLYGHQLLHKLYNHKETKRYMMMDVPIYDDQGKEIGKKTLWSLFSDVAQEDY